VYLLYGFYVTVFFLSNLNEAISVVNFVALLVHIVHLF